MRGSRVRLQIMAVATAAAIITGVWWWITYRTQIIPAVCTARVDESGPPGSLPRCLPGPVDWTKRVVATTFVVSVITLIGTVLIELVARWQGSRTTGSLRPQA